MASISQHKSGYRAQVAVLGVRDSKVFRTKREAINWSSARENDIRSKATLPVAERHTLGELLERYRDEIVPTHKSSVRETAAVNFILRRLAIDLPLSKIDSTVISAYRDARLKEVKPATILRELKVLGTAFEEARIEWKWISENPVRQIRKPAASRHRDRTLTWSEIRTMLTAAGRKTPTGIAILLALRTGMRAGEICRLKWCDVHEKQVVLAETKTNPRKVPLSKKARRVFAMAKGLDPLRVLGISEGHLSGQFIRYRKRTGLSGFTFHDTRHTAATWMSKKVDVLTLCRIMGWTNPKMAMVYVNTKVTDIADMLD